MKNLVLSILIIGAVAIAGYLIFTIEYQEDNELGRYTLELPITDEIQYYRVHSVSHDKFTLNRSNDGTTEIINIRNTIDKPLDVTIYEMPQRVDVSITLMPLNEERNIMYLDLIIKEIALIGIAAVGLFLLNRPEKEKDIIE